MNRSVGGGCTTLVNMISFWANPIAELVRKVSSIIPGNSFPVHRYLLPPWAQGVAVPVLNALLEDALLECIGALNDESYALDISEWVSISPPLFTCRFAPHSLFANLFLTSRFWKRRNATRSWEWEALSVCTTLGQYPVMHLG